MEQLRDRDEFTLWLERLGQAREELKCMQTELTLLYTEATRCTRLPKTGSGSSATGGSAQERYACFADEYARKKRQVEREKSELNGFLSRLGDRKAALVLKLRYVHGLSWDEIGGELAGCGMRMSRSALFKLHRRALEEARALYTAGLQAAA